MLRFIRNKRKGKKGSGKKGVSDEDPEGAASSSEAGGLDTGVVLTSVRAISPEEVEKGGATKYPGEENGPVQQEQVATSLDQGEAAVPPPPPPPPPAAPSTTPDDNTTTPPPPDTGVKMDPIPEESTPVKAYPDLPNDTDSQAIASESPYAYPDGETEFADDWESVVTVIEKTQPEEIPDASDPSQHTYATVLKPSQRLKHKAEQLDDRYTPDKDFTQVTQPHGTDTSEDDSDTFAKAPPSDDQADELPLGEREEDYVIYVTKDSLHRPNIRRSPVVVEATLSTFDSPERQSQRDLDNERLRDLEYLRQQSAEYNNHPRPMEMEDDFHGRHAREYYRPEYVSHDVRAPMADDYEYRYGYGRDYPSDDGMIVRHSPSGAFIQRTHSLPSDHYGRHRYPGGGGDYTYPYRHRPRHAPRNKRHRNGGHSPRSRHRHGPTPFRNPYIHPGYDPKGHPQINGHYDPYVIPRNDVRPNGDVKRNGLPVQANGYPVRQTSQPNGHLPYMMTQNGRKGNNEARPDRNSPPTEQIKREENEVLLGETRVSFQDGQNGNGGRKASPVGEEGEEKEKEALLGEEDAVSVGTAASDMSEDELRPPRLLIRRSIAICFAWFCMGFYTEVVGPNIPYLQSRVNGTYVYTAHALASRGAGMLLGSTVGGLLCEVSPNWLDLWISTSLLLGAMSTAAVPWSLKVIHLCIILGLGGFSKGFLQVATLTMLLRIWSHRNATTIVFIAHVAYAMGALPTSQLAYLFETGVLEKLMFGVNATSAPPRDQPGHYNGEGPPIASEAQSGGGNALSFLDYIPRPMYPFDMAAILTFVCGAVFLMFFSSAIRSVPQVKAVTPKVQDIERRPLEGLRPKNWFLPSATCGVRPLLFLLVFFILPFAVMATFGTFLHLCTGSQGFSHSEALLLQTIFWAAVALGRALAPLLSRCMAPNGLIISCVTMSIVSTALLAVYGEQYPIFTWIFITLLGLFSGPIIPAGLTLCNLWLGPSAMGCAAAFFWFALGDGTFSWVAGYLLYNFTARALIFMCLAATGASFLFYLPMIPLLAKQKPKIKKKGKKLKGKVVD